MLLGGTSDTEDAWGQITYSKTTGFDPGRLKQVIAELTGAIEQVPPMYSALHHKGQRLYELARRGEVVERPPRQVTVFQLKLLSISESKGQPLLALEVSCSPGTYIRSLCRDIGNALGTGGYLCALKRLQDGLFGLDEATRLDQLTAFGADLKAVLLPMDYPLQHWPAYQLQTAAEATHISHGRGFPVYAGEATPLVRIYEQCGRMAAVGCLKKGKTGLLLQPIKVFHPD